MNDLPCFPRSSAAYGSWFCMVSFNIVMSSLCSGYIWLRNSSQFREALLLHGFLPLFFGVSACHSTPTCNLKSDFAALVRFCEICEILRNLFKILKSVPLFRELVTPRSSHSILKGSSVAGYVWSYK